MAKKASAKTSTPKTAAGKDDAAKSAGSSQKISKIEAVRQIKKMYPKAKPRELEPLLLEKFGVKLSAQRISMAGVYLRKQAGKPSKRGKTAAALNPGAASDMTIREFVAAQKMINDLGGEARVQKLLTQYAAAKKIFANA
jgi:hypothetical protein